MKRYYGNQLKIISLATELNLLYSFGKLSPFQMLKFNLKESICLKKSDLKDIILYTIIITKKYQMHKGIYFCRSSKDGSFSNFAESAFLTVYSQF